MITAHLSCVYQKLNATGVPRAKEEGNNGMNGLQDKGRRLGKAAGLDRDFKK
jgi:hypothetical protein